MIHNRFFSFIIFFLFCIAPAMFMVKDCHAMPPTTNLDGQIIKGTVIETMNASGYTYILLKTAEEEIWVAIPGINTIEKGSKVASQPGMIMTNFKSRALDRTFATILFSAGLVEYNGTGDTTATVTDMKNTVKTPDPPKVSYNESKISFDEAVQAERHRAHIDQKKSDMEAQISGGSRAAIVPPKEISIKKAIGDNSYTIEECFNKRNELNNQKVQVRGKVVHISKMIMGTNWVHLQDGTGNHIENNFNLVFRTQEVPELNSIITMEGILHADQDFGFGYRYKAIVKNAVIL